MVSPRGGSWVPWLTRTAPRLAPGRVRRSQTYKEETALEANAGRKLELVAIQAVNIATLISIGKTVLPSRASQKLFVMETKRSTSLVGTGVAKPLKAPLVAERVVLVPLLVATRSMST